MPLTNPAFQATGDIFPSRFVKINGSHKVAQAGTNERAMGVSTEGTKFPPGSQGLSAPYKAAEAGDNLTVYGDGDICLLEIGSGGVTAGDLLKSDTNGKGVTSPQTETSLVYIGAVALETAAAG